MRPLLLSLCCGLLVSCGEDPPEGLPVGTPPTEVLQAPVSLLEVVTADHFGPSTALPVSGHASEEDFSGGMDDWTPFAGKKVRLDPEGGRNGSAGVAFDAMRGRLSTYLYRRFPVSGNERCRVGAWVRTEGLKGMGVHAGARMEVAELGRDVQDDARRPKALESWRYLTHLSGDNDWTHQELDIPVYSGTRYLEVRLTGGFDGSTFIGGGRPGSDPSREPAGTAWFDDVTVHCVAEGFPVGQQAVVDGALDPQVVKRVTVAADNRPAVVTDRSVAWSVQVDRTDDVTVTAQVGLANGTSPKARACFVIRVDGEEKARKCRSGKTKTSRGWMPISVKLPAGSEGASQVVFETRVGKVKGASATLAAWANPRLERPTASAERPPDVLLILVDTLRADSVYAIDERRAGASDHLDALAASGTLYTQARSPAPWTLPSTATLLSGLEPPRHGAGWRMRRAIQTLGAQADEQRRLRFSGMVEGTPRLASLLRDEGYLTRGWYSNHYLDPRFGFGAGFSRWQRFKSSDIKGAGRAVDDVRKALEAHPLGGPQPQLLFVHVIDPHTPYLAREPLPEGYALGDDIKYTIQEQDGITAKVLQEPEHLKRKHAHSVREIYDVDVHYLDQMMGDLVGLVDDDTLVILTSDHGEQFMEHGHYAHGNALYDELLRVPLVVRWPKGAHAGTRIDHPVILSDVTATVAELAGADTSGLDGTPLPRPGDAPESRLLVFGPVVKGVDRVGVLEWPYKHTLELPSLGIDPSVKRPKVGAELYHLVNDPEEKTNLAAAEPEVLARLEEALAKEVDRSLPGTHYRCAAPHPELVFTADQPFVRGVPFSAGPVDIPDDRSTIRVAASSTKETRLVLEATNAAEVHLSPAEACTTWKVAIPDMEVTLDQDQIDNLKAIGYLE